MTNPPMNAGDALSIGLVLGAAAFVLLAAIAANALEHETREVMQLGITKKQPQNLQLPHFQRRNAATEALEANKKGAPPGPQKPPPGALPEQTSKKIILEGGQPVGYPPPESEGK